MNGCRLKLKILVLFDSLSWFPFSFQFFFFFKNRDLLSEIVPSIERIRMNWKYIVNFFFIFSDQKNAINKHNFYRIRNKKVFAMLVSFSFSSGISGSSQLKHSFQYLEHGVNTSWKSIWMISYWRKYPQGK